MSEKKYVPKPWDIYSIDSSPDVFLCFDSAVCLVSGLNVDGEIVWHYSANKKFHYRGRGDIQAASGKNLVGYSDIYVPKAWDIYSKAGDPRAPLSLCVGESPTWIQGLDSLGRIEYRDKRRRFYYRGRARVQRRGKSDEPIERAEPRRDNVADRWARLLSGASRRPPAFPQGDEETEA